MKVIKRGNGQKGWSKKFTCTGYGNSGGGCGATLLVEQVDVILTTSNCKDETDYHHTFVCPLCAVATDIPKSIHLPFTPTGSTEVLRERQAEVRRDFR